MIKTSSINLAVLSCIVLIQSSIVHSAELLMESDIDVRAEYNDNIFLTNQPHDSVTAIKITPTISGILKEQHWQGIFEASLRSNNYSDSDLDSNDKYFNLTGLYNEERNIYSLNLNYDLDSNLNSVTTDFGIAGRRVNRRNKSVTPQYTRLITERLSLTLSFSYTDVEYIDAEDTNFTPYISKNATAMLAYDLTERDSVTFNLVGVDYASKDDSVTYELFLTRVGIDHEFSETLNADFLIGVSRRTSTNFNTQIIDFFGETVVVPVIVDAEDRGFVLDAGITKKFERRSIEGRISRDNTTNSFGGLDQADKIKINYRETISELWRYDVAVRIEDITSISTTTSSADRDVLFVEARTYYSITEKWNMNASYRYVRRKFKSAGGSSSAPESNRLYVGLTYNFPSLSTF